jgi:hypothetical protein
LLDVVAPTAQETPTQCHFRPIYSSCLDATLVHSRELRG